MKNTIITLTLVLLCFASGVQAKAKSFDTDTKSEFVIMQVDQENSVAVFTVEEFAKIVVTGNLLDSLKVKNVQTKSFLVLHYSDIRPRLGDQKSVNPTKLFKSYIRKRGSPTHTVA